MRPGIAMVAVLVVAFGAMPPAACDDAVAWTADADGRALMDAVYERHGQYPYVYEEQSMVLVDRKGNRDTRRLVRYSRVEESGVMRVLLHFRFPREVQGVALLATRLRDGSMARHVFLPALGPWLIANGEPGLSTDVARDDHFLGTDFSIENLTGEILDDYRYVRREDARIEQADYFVVDVYPAGARTVDDKPLRRHFIRQDRLYITRTDHLDRHGRIAKRQTHHDLVPVNGDTWRANMILMDNRLENHQTIVKIDQRVFSPDYVPADVFTAAWIFANAPPPEPVEDDEPLTLPEIAAGLDGGAGQ